jgi:hypothetical protein
LGERLGQSSSSSSSPFPYCCAIPALDEQSAARGMTMPIVDLLESIHIDEDQADLNWAAGCLSRY